MVCLLGKWGLLTFGFASCFCLPLKSTPTYSLPNEKPVQGVNALQAHSPANLQNAAGFCPKHFHFSCSVCCSKTLENANPLLHLRPLNSFVRKIWKVFSQPQKRHGQMMIHPTNLCPAVTCPPGNDSWKTCNKWSRGCAAKFEVACAKGCGQVPTQGLHCNEKHAPHLKKKTTCSVWMQVVHLCIGWNQVFFTPTQQLFLFFAAFANGLWATQHTTQRNKHQLVCESLHTIACFFQKQQLFKANEIKIFLAKHIAFQMSRFSILAASWIAANDTDFLWTDSQCCISVVWNVFLIGCNSKRSNMWALRKMSNGYVIPSCTGCFFSFEYKKENRCCVLVSMFCSCMKCEIGCLFWCSVLFWCHTHAPLFASHHKMAVLITLKVMSLWVEMCFAIPSVSDTVTNLVRIHT